MATWSCSLRVAACCDTGRVTQQGASACPLYPMPPCQAHPDGLSPSRASSSSCHRSAAAWWSTERSEEGAALGLALASLKHLCLTSEWSMSMAGDGGDGPGPPHWGLVLSPGAGSSSLVLCQGWCWESWLTDRTAAGTAEGGCSLPSPQQVWDCPQPLGDRGGAEPGLRCWVLPAPELQLLLLPGPCPG